MRRIRARGNKSTELRLIRAMRDGKMVGWRRGWKMVGNPDFVFPKARVAVFVDGCFWHGCRKCFRTPTANKDYWVLKIGTNRERDRRISRTLRQRGWSVLRIWEHDLTNVEKIMGRLKQHLLRERATDSK
jgi:DNA mismatch endonuclease (patch repair protein)